ERITGTSCHKAWQIRLPLDHLGWRNPIWPFGLPTNSQHSLPLKAVPAHSYPIAYRSVVSLNEVEVSIGRIDNDGAGGLVGAIEYDLPLIGRRQLLLARIRHKPRLIVDRNLAGA